MKGKQHKLDVNHNGHLDAEDFKMLRSGKKGKKKHRKDEDKFIERVVGMLMDRLDENNKAIKSELEAEAGFSREDVNKPLRAETPAEQVPKMYGPDALRRHRARKFGKREGPPARFKRKENILPRGFPVLKKPLP